MNNIENLLSINKFKDNLGQNSSNKIFLSKGENLNGNISQAEQNIFKKFENILKNYETINNFNSQSMLNQDMDFTTNSFLSDNYSNISNSNSSQFLRENISSNSNSVINNANDLRNLKTNSNKNVSETQFKIDMSGMQNTIKQQTDIDSVIREITKKLEDAINSSAKGVY